MRGMFGVLKNNYQRNLSTYVRVELIIINSSESGRCHQGSLYAVDLDVLEFG